jgi:mono/diheme cytochrome c family protein
MPGSAEEVLIRWETARRQGRKPTVRELCVDCPDLEEEVRRRIRAILTMEGVLGVAEVERHSQGEGDPDKTVLGADPGLPRTVEPCEGRSGWRPQPSEGAEDSAHTRPGLHPERLPVVPGYDILRVVDHGGMGVVYEARQVGLGRRVAVKMISLPRPGPKVIARFRLEAEAAARLSHPNFVPIFEVGQAEGQPFFSMEFVCGGSLAERLERLPRQPLSARQAAELTATLARAVHAAHEAGIVHRDLKPSNILFDSAGAPKIADFGLAKLLDAGEAHTHTGEILGTPNYMAPEQAEGRKDRIGPATDVYALGAILYECLTGRPPFQGDTPLASLRLILAEEPAPPSRLALVPRDLEAICMKCLEKAPGQRYGSALALAEDLERFLAGDPVTAHPGASPRRAWKWLRRRPRTAAGGLLAGVLALAAGGFLFAQYRAEREARLTAEKQAPLVRAILQRHCLECHGRHPGREKKNLNVLDHRRLLDGARRIVVPGSPEDSRLLQRISDGSMPPEEEEIRRPRLSEDELTILKQWILGGAPAFGSGETDLAALDEPSSKAAARAKAVFVKKCYACHRYDVAKGGIKILHHRLLVSVRKVVVPGHPEESELFGLLEADDESRMPPAPAKRLSPEEIDAIRVWILEGALPFPRGD